MVCLDTNIWSYLMRQPPAGLVDHLKQLKTSDICLAELTRAELLFGAIRSRHPLVLRQRIEALLAPYQHLPFDGLASEHYAEIRHALESSGKPISLNDIIIAATARSVGATLITGNLREFSRVPGLVCEDWTCA